MAAKRSRHVLPASLVGALATLWLLVAFLAAGTILLEVGWSMIASVVVAGAFACFSMVGVTYVLASL